MRRILDLTTPRMRTDEKRINSRYNRGLPVAICPWSQGKPVVSELILCMTRDLSDNGISVLTTSDIDFFDEVVFTILLDTEICSELCFFQATLIRKNRFFGFCEYGLQVNEFLNDDHRTQLAPLLRLLTNSAGDATNEVHGEAV